MMKMMKMSGRQGLQLVSSLTPAIMNVPRVSAVIGNLT